MGKLSPMMTHYLKLKEQYLDCILLFRLGDFYEMFFEDAKTASSVLDITLTGRDCGLDERAPMCGVPFHSIDNYIAKLISLGYKVAICEQLTQAGQGKGMVERDVVRVITPGTVIDESIIKDSSNNYLCCLYLTDESLSVSWADISTGEFNVTEKINPYDGYVEDILSSINPSEIICNEYCYDKIKDLPCFRLNRFPKPSKYYEWCFQEKKSTEILLNHFNISSLLVLELDCKIGLICSSGALINYLLETQKRTLSHIDGLKIVQENKFLFLDSNTRRNLEITLNSRDNSKKGSLLWVVDKTCTSMGARNIKRWVEQPVFNKSIIDLRLNAVEEIISNRVVKDEIIESLKLLKDIERISARIAYGNITPKEIFSLNQSLSLLPKIKKSLNDFSSEYLIKINNDINAFDELVLYLNSVVSEDAPNNIKDGCFVKSGYNAELDSFRTAKKEWKKWIENLEEEERTSTQIKNLKIGFNKVFGYYIEVSNSNKDKVPFRYVRKQTLTGGERYITEELKKIEEILLSADDKALDIENKIFEIVKETLIKCVSSIKKTANAIAELDTLISFANVSYENKYIKPSINENKNMLIAGGRHPVVEKLIGKENFVRNSIKLNSVDDRIMIITGPNMAGKSTYMRQVALIILLAHIGCFVPADTAEIALTDRIFTRIGASDDLSYGQSTFMVEMIEVAVILRNSTENSLVLLDEVGRGTSTYDGLSIAWAVMDYISNKLKCKTLFSTHYHELSELENTMSGIKNYQICVSELLGKIVFTHNIKPGGANKSFGIEVASLAGLPKEVISRAKILLKKLEENDLVAKNKSQVKKIINENFQASFFDIVKESNENTNEIIDRLNALNIDEMTPIKALSELFELKELLNKLNY